MFLEHWQKYSIHIKGLYSSNNYSLVLHLKLFLSSFFLYYLLCWNFLQTSVIGFGQPLLVKTQKDKTSKHCNLRNLVTFNQTFHFMPKCKNSSPPKCWQYFIIEKAQRDYKVIRRFHTCLEYLQAFVIPCFFRWKNSLSELSFTNA